MSLLKTNSADMQPVFDALDAYIAGSQATNATASVALDGSGVTHSMTAGDRSNDNRFSYSERIVGVRVSIEPVAATLGPGQSQQFTATSSDAVQPAWVWSMPPGSLGTLTADGLYTAPATIAATTGVAITAYAGQSWATVSANLVP